MESARAAVDAEYRMGSQWTPLQCSGAHRARRTIWKLTVVDLGTVSWTWEGAMAVCPHTPTAPPDTWDDADALCWRGTIISADTAQGVLYVDVDILNSDMPHIGPFFVRPYAYLNSLHTLFCRPIFAGLAPALSDALRATAGQDIGRPLPAQGAATVHRAASHAWGCLWGPPGTGKTWTIGQHVAAQWPNRRILVLSTTNRATDGVTLAIARAIREHHPGEPLKHRLVRVGSGAEINRFVPDRLTGVLIGGEADLRHRLTTLRQRRQDSTDTEQRALLTEQIRTIHRRLEQCSRDAFLAETCRVVVTTAFNALRQLTDPDVLTLIEADRAPFDLVVIDEAGLVCRAATAALSLLAATQVLLVGDPHQLAPIARMSRLLPPAQSTWLSESALSHLTVQAATHQPAVSMLRTQHRMHPSIRSVVSQYQYADQLEDASALRGPQAETHRPSLGLPRAGWVVLDAAAPLADARASRGPRAQSWVRHCTVPLLAWLLDAHPHLIDHHVMVVTPFAAQAQRISTWLTAHELANWTASTIHSQQGAEAEVVIVDTVNGALGVWPAGEWQRLMNVALSRARSHVLLLATRAEMEAPWLRPLQDLLTPYTLRPGYGGAHWQTLPTIDAVVLSGRAPAPSDGLGAQIAALRQTRPVLSAAQEQLVSLPVDGGPRLVRGVAGSGKTLVLAHWLAKALHQHPGQSIWVIYGNAALHQLLQHQIQSAWQQRFPHSTLPWKQITMWHIRDLLRALLPERGLVLPANDFDYNTLSRRWLRAQRHRTPTARCDMMFVDEAQDLGDQTLRMLALLITPPDPSQPRRRPMMIFHDQDQNIYRRPSPRWSALGLDLDGRTALLTEGFRSTRPITTVAINTLYRLVPPIGSPAYQHLLREGLLQLLHHAGQRHWRVQLSLVDGPQPVLASFADRDAELAFVTHQITTWIQADGISPGDIRVLCHTPAIRDELFAMLCVQFHETPTAVAHQTGRNLPDDLYTLLITTPHSFKGHDAEVVAVVGADRLATRAGPLARVLYVAMTRARSMLMVSGLKDPKTPGGQAIMSALQQAFEQQRTPTLSAPPPPPDRLQSLARAHPTWLMRLWSQHVLHWSPMGDIDNGLVLRPLFWFSLPDDRRVACLATQPDDDLIDQLSTMGIIVILPGEYPDLRQGNTPGVRWTG